MSEPPRPTGEPAPGGGTSAPQVQPAESRRPRTCSGSLAAVLGILLGGLYVLNPTLGVLELIPDNLPGVGNLDEAGAAALLIFGLQYLLGRRRRAPGLAPGPSRR